MKCKNCNACQKGFFKSKPNTYVCIGTKELFVIDNIEQFCTVYQEKENKLWSWNETNDENWTHGTFDTKEDAIRDAIGCRKFIEKYMSTDNPTIYVGECELIPLRTDPDPDRIMEELDEAYCDDSGCDTYIYEGVTDEQRKWLQDKLSELMNEFHKKISLNPGWFTVTNIEELNLNNLE